MGEVALACERGACERRQREAQADAGKRESRHRVGRIAGRQEGERGEPRGQERRAADDVRDPGEPGRERAGTEGRKGQRADDPRAGKRP